MSTEKPIIFNSAMVLAILEGRKTQTRRPAPIAKLDIQDCPEYASEKHGPFTSVFAKFSKPTKGSISTTTATHCAPAELNSWVAGKFGPWQVGDLLWVRETWCEASLEHRDYKATPQVYYRAAGVSADGDEIRREYIKLGHDYRWKPSIHMPRWASRITLRVKRVWVERVQEISEADAESEGLDQVSKDGTLFKFGIPDADGLPGTDNFGWPWDEWERNPRDAFAKLWDSIYSDRFPWAGNYWVWCCEFEVVK